jgi:putative thiamine transport system permease protein
MPKALPTALAAGVVALPVLGGLLGTILPAFGIIPALGGHHFSLDPWRALLAQPGLGASVWLSVSTGLAATLISGASVALFCAAFHGTRGFRLAQAAIAPLLATPHVAIAIGLLAIAAPSGLVARAIAPLAGWSTPPDVASVNDAAGISLVLGLVLKEAPYLLLMTLAALNQIPAMRLMAMARSLGQPAPVAFLKIVFPLVYRQIRLPVLAVLAYAMSVVDIAILLGPERRPPLAVLVVRWFFDPDLSKAFPAAAAACLVLICTAAALLIWYAAERALGPLQRFWAASGGRSGAMAIRLGGLALPILLALATLSLAAAAMWSVAGPWRFPDLLPIRFDLASWTAQQASLAAPFRTTLATALAATALALVFSVAALEAVARHGRAARQGLLAFTLLPLLVPQASFLFGVQVALLSLDLDGGWAALIWAHLVFVLPYVLLSLTAPYVALDPRLAHTAACLGASPFRILITVKLPILLRPLLSATAVGVAVSAGQYLATLFAGGGRMATLATEAVTLASGGDRRVMGVFAVAQSLLPIVFFAAALLLPRLVWRRRAALA